LLTIALLLVCLALGAVVWMQNQQHAAQATHHEELTNDYSKLEDKYKEEVLVRTSLETNLTATQLKAERDLRDERDKLAEAYTNLEKTLAEARLAKDAVAKAAAQIADNEKRIAELQRTNTDLDTEAINLHRQVSTLDAQIKETQKLLEDSQGEKIVLREELKQLEAQKEELERRLSDIAALKSQVRTLQDNLSTARRITWLSEGVYNNIGLKGAQLLVTPTKPAPPNTNKPLNVELRRGGGFNIITNAPSTNAPSPAAPSGR
jgi:chromosome segregation ATPase